MKSFDQLEMDRLLERMSRTLDDAFIHGNRRDGDDVPIGLRAFAESQEEPGTITAYRPSEGIDNWCSFWSKWAMAEDQLDQGGGES